MGITIICRPSTMCAPAAQLNSISKNIPGRTASSPPASAPKCRWCLPGPSVTTVPLPGVIPNVYDAQDAMRAYTKKATTVIALATQLHTIATGNMSPSWQIRDGKLRPVYFYTVGYLGVRRRQAARPGKPVHHQHRDERPGLSHQHRAKFERIVRKKPPERSPAVFLCFLERPVVHRHADQKEYARDRKGYKLQLDCPFHPLGIRHHRQPQTNQQHRVGRVDHVGKPVRRSCKRAPPSCRVNPTRSASGAMMGMTKNALALDEPTNSSSSKITAYNSRIPTNGDVDEMALAVWVQDRIHDPAFGDNQLDAQSH